MTSDIPKCQKKKLEKEMISGKVLMSPLLLSRAVETWCWMCDETALAPLGRDDDEMTMRYMLTWIYIVDVKKNVKKCGRNIEWDGIWDI